MIEIILVVVLTLLSVTLIPWWMKRDYERRTLTNLKTEIQDNIMLLEAFGCQRAPDAGDSDAVALSGAEVAPPVLSDRVFRSMRRQDIHSRYVTAEDMDMLEKVFAASSRATLRQSAAETKAICTENMRILDDLLRKIEEYLREERLR